MLKPNDKTRNRKERFEKLGKAVSSVTENNPYWQSIGIKNPWRATRSIGSVERTEEFVRGGPTVMQIDTGIRNF